MGCLTWILDMLNEGPFSGVEFRAPEGRNFRSASDKLEPETLCEAVTIVLEFLRGVTRVRRLYTYSDWWEHDGHFSASTRTTFKKLLENVKTPQAMASIMPCETMVHVGVAPVRSPWYLRFYLDEDIADLLKKGSYEPRRVPEFSNKFDVTLPPALADRFRCEVVPKLPCEMTEQDSVMYYDSITADDR
jgi:hypothetical protein